jgi:hypothetical protein
MFAVTYNSKREPDQPLHTQKIEPVNGIVSIYSSCAAIIDTKGPLEVIVCEEKYVLEEGRHYFTHGILPTFGFVSIHQQNQPEFSVTQIIDSNTFAFSNVCKTSIILPMFKGEKRYVLSTNGIFVNTDDIIYRNAIDVDDKWYEYDHTDIYVGAYWYHTDIANIIVDPEVTQYLAKSDDFIRQSYPPCVVVFYNPENDKKLRDLLESKYGLTFKGSKHPKRTVHMKTPEQVRTEFVSERDKLIANLTVLMDEAVITELHIKKIDLEPWKPWNLKLIIK